MKLLSREFIGIEMNTEYVEISKKRIEAVVVDDSKQQELGL